MNNTLSLKTTISKKSVRFQKLKEQYLNALKTTLIYMFKKKPKN